MSMVPAVYSPHSYVDYVVDGSAIATTQTIFAFPKEFLILGHLEAWHYSLTDGAWVQVPASSVVFSGPSGSATGTLQATAIARVTGDTLRLKRVTPDTGAGRLVDFQPGSLTEADLDIQARQNLFVMQELRDEIDLRIGLEASGEAYWDGKNKSIRNVGGPLVGSDAAIYQNILDLVAGTGELPPVTTLNNNSLLAVVAGIWSTVPADIVKLLLTLGTAADRNVGTGTADVPDITAADARYLRISKDLSEGNAATMRSNLGIPATNPAALLETTDSSIAADRVVELDASARYPAADGRNIDLSSHVLVGNSGRHGAMARFDIGNFSQIFGVDATPGPATTVPATFDIPAGHDLQTQLNGSSDIAVSSGGDTWTLKTGTYWITINILVTNEDTGDPVGFAWNLREDPAGAATILRTHPTVFIPPRVATVEYQYVHTFHREKVIVSGATETYDIFGGKLTVITGDPRIARGEVIIEKVND